VVHEDLGVYGGDIFAFLGASKSGLDEEHYDESGKEKNGSDPEQIDSSFRADAALVA